MENYNDICIEVDEFYDFFNGKLNQEESQKITKHLATCELCQELEEAIRNIKEENPTIDTQKQFQEAAEEGVVMIKNAFVKRQKAKTISMISKYVAASVIFLIAISSIIWLNTQNKFFETSDIAYLDNIQTRGTDGQNDVAKFNYDNESYEKASLFFAKRFKSNPTYQTGVYLGLAYFGDREYDKAIAIFEELLESEEVKNSEKAQNLIYFELFKLYLQKGETQKVNNLKSKLKNTTFDDSITKVLQK